MGPAVRLSFGSRLLVLQPKKPGDDCLCSAGVWRGLLGGLLRLTMRCPLTDQNVEPGITGISMFDALNEERVGVLLCVLRGSRRNTAPHDCLAELFATQFPGLRMLNSC